MKANELRIGNYVKYDFLAMAIFEPEYQIENGADIQVHQNHTSFYPIPLTEEWLLKFGFKFNENKGQYETGNHFKVYSNGIDIAIRNGDFRLWWENDDDTYYNTYWTAIKHVHQLQNLFFALTEEELTIKEQ
jgi:hypothetical protein